MSTVTPTPGARADGVVQRRVGDSLRRPVLELQPHLVKRPRAAGGTQASGEATEHGGRLPLQRRPGLRGEADPPEQRHEHSYGDQPARRATRRRAPWPALDARRDDAHDVSEQPAAEPSHRATFADRQRIDHRTVVRWGCDASVPPETRLSDYANDTSRSFFALTEAALGPLDQPERGRQVDFLLVARHEVTLIAPGLSPRETLRAA